MSPQCLPSSFSLIGLTVPELTCFNIFKMATVAAILNIKMEGFWQFKISMSPQCLPPSLGSIQLRVQEQICFEDFQDGRCGSHPGYPNGRILAILNLYVALMPPIKLRLNPTYGLGGDVVWRISRSWIPERNNFSNSEYLCRSDASCQVLAQSILWFGRRSRLKNFKMATITVWYQKGTILVILNLYVTWIPPINFLLNQT